MGKCIYCGKESGLVSQFLGVCRECILKDFQAIESHILHSIHTSRLATSRKNQPVTSRRHTEECRRAAEEAGLRNVRIGNVHLLGKEY